MVKLGVVEKGFGKPTDKWRATEKFQNAIQKTADKQTFCITMFFRKKRRYFI